MNGKTGASRGLRCAGSLAAAVAVAVLVTACGVVQVHVGFTAGSSPAESVDLAYAQCMRAHGVPNLPIPNPSEHVRISGHLAGNGPLARANDACQHLLPAGSTAAVSASRPRRGIDAGR